MKATFTRMAANKMLAGEPDVRFWREIVVPQKVRLSVCSAFLARLAECN